MKKEYIAILLILLVLMLSAQSVVGATPATNRQSNAVNGGWGVWYVTECSVGCGGGVRNVQRDCNNPTPLNGGAECLREDGTWTTVDNRTEIIDSIACNTAVCIAPVDATPPSKPQNLSAQVISDTQIHLSWSAATDDIGVTQYRVYDARGIVMGTNPSSYDSYEPAGLSKTEFDAYLLQPGTTYTFFVAAIDAYGNESELSEPVTATTLVYVDDLALINPYLNFTYLGAFRPPQSSGSNSSWSYAGYGLAYYPDGDPSGAVDGFPGSLFGRSHVYQWFMGEFTIPIPKLTRDISQLPYATTLQNFAQVDTFVHDPIGIPIGSSEYLPAKGTQTSGKIYSTWGSNYLWEKWPSFSMNELTLSTPNTQGWWYVGIPAGAPAYYATVFYTFAIPQAWADLYTGGRSLMLGGTRSGGYNGFGTAFYAVGPWLDGDPLAYEASASYVTLTQYGQTYSVNTQNGITMRDEYFGGAWLTLGNRQSVILVGSKGFGPSYYRSGGGGYIASLKLPSILFFDPQQMAEVAVGTRQPDDVQPYAIIDISEYVYRDNWRYSLGDVAYDAENNLLYVWEVVSDGKPVIHVWQIREPFDSFLPVLAK